MSVQTTDASATTIFGLVRVNSFESLSALMMNYSLHSDPEIFLCYVHQRHVECFDLVATDKVTHHVARDYAALRSRRRPHSSTRFRGLTEAGHIRAKSKRCS